MKRLRRILRRFGLNERGVSAVEFALIAPVMIVMYFASVEVSFLLMVDRKTTNSASALGDLVARTTSVDDAEMNNIFNAAGAIFAPYAASDARLRVTSLVDNGGRAEVAWSDARGYRAYSPGTQITVPNGVLPSGGSVIMAEVQFQYESTLGYFFPTMRSLSDKFYLRPRRTTVIDRN